MYYELADEFFKQLRQQIEVTQTELRESEQLEIYYHAQGEEPILVSKIGYLPRVSSCSMARTVETTIAKSSRSCSAAADAESWYAMERRKNAAPSALSSRREVRSKGISLWPGPESQRGRRD